MRTYDELCEAIASCEIPYARIAFDTDDPDELQAPPYVLLMPRGTNNFMAGNKIVLHITSYDVELYVDGSSTALEANVDDRSNDLGDLAFAAHHHFLFHSAFAVPTISVSSCVIAA